MSAIDVSVVNTEKFREINPKRRLDASYFGRSAIAAVDAVRTLPGKTLGSIAHTLRKGIFDIRAESYTEVGDGFPFVRVGDLRSGLIDETRTAWISAEAHESEIKTRLTYGDIILSKTAYAAACFVNISECNVSQDTIAVKLKPFSECRYKSGFVVAYLRSRYGLPLMKREFQGNVQQHLALEDAKSLLIPLASKRLQHGIETLIRQADEILRSARQLSVSSEDSLASTLGLPRGSSDELSTFIGKASEVRLNKRLDAKFFSPDVKTALEHLSLSGQCVGDVATPRRIKMDRARGDAIDYIEIGDVGQDGIVSSSSYTPDQAPSRATWIVRSGDVITSLVRPLRRISARIFDDQDGYICSSGFSVLTPKLVHTEVLLAFLRLRPICEILHLYASASMYPTINENDILALPFPEIPEALSEALVQAALQTRALRNQATVLMTRAVVGVETFIESDEGIAIRYVEGAR